VNTRFLLQLMHSMLSTRFLSKTTTDLILQFDVCVLYALTSTFSC